MSGVSVRRLSCAAPEENGIREVDDPLDFTMLPLMDAGPSCGWRRADFIAALQSS
jgi:hypothetical protein